MDGTNGTGKYGLGPAANVKGKRMNDSKMVLDQANESFLAEQSRLETEAESIASSVTSNAYELYVITMCIKHNHKCSVKQPKSIRPDIIPLQKICHN